MTLVGFVTRIEQQSQGNSLSEMLTQRILIIFYLTNRYFLNARTDIYDMNSFKYRLISKEIHVFFQDEEAVTGVACSLFQDTKFRQGF